MPDERLHILIVDDDALDRQAARRALSSAGLEAQVSEVASCAEAVRALISTPFDVALLDFQLPDGTGLDVLTQARAAGVETPVIMLTGHGDELIAVELMKAGAADYLSKSKLSPGSLGRSVQNVLRLRRAERQARRADEARHRSEAQFRRVAESSIIGIVFWDPSGRLTGANDAFLEMIGYTRADLDAGVLDWTALTPPEWRDTDHARMVELAALGACAPYEKECRRRDGGRVAVLVSASLLDGAAGEGLAFVVDVTERRRAEQAQRFLAEAGAVLSSSLDAQTTLANVARLAVPRLADWCAVDLLDERGHIRRVEIAHTDPEKARLARELGRRYPSNPEAPNGPPQVLRSGRSELAVEITDALLVANARDAEHLEILRRVGLRSYMCVPLAARGRTLGAITLVSSETDRRYTPADLALAEELGRRAGLAVENARLFLETQARAEREAVVNAIGRALRGSLDADEILSTATREVGQLLGVSRCGWYWLNPEADALEVASQQYVAAGADSFSGSYPLTLWSPEMRALWNAGEPVVVSDANLDPRADFHRETFLQPLGIRAYIGYPVFLRGAWAGLFAVHQTDGPRVWTDAEVTLLRQVADMLAPTLENARQYAREHRVSDMLQAAFLSNIPDRLGELDLATVYRVGLEESHVGGDFYDAFPLSDGRVGLVMADVSGKGLSAAVLTATVKFSLRAFAAEVAAPDLVLSRLNRTLRNESAGLGEHFVTLFYAVFEPRSGRLLYASAGHETQVIKRAAGGTTLLGSTGPILGIIEHRFNHHVEHLGPGDSLVLYTDGLTEARSARTRELLDLSRVAALIGRADSALGAGALAASLEAAALDWTAGRPQDDMALLVVRRRDGSALLQAADDGYAADSPLARDRSVGSSDGDLLFHFAFPSRPEYAAEVRQAVAHWMGTLGFGRDAVEDFQTAITEAVTNAVRHGSPHGSADQFRVAGYRQQDVTLAVNVWDSGPGLAGLDPDRAMPAPEALGGRGLPLMRALSDRVQYQRTETGMCVRLTKTRPAERK